MTALKPDVQACVDAALKQAAAPATSPAVQDQHVDPVPQLGNPTVHNYAPPIVPVPQTAPAMQARIAAEMARGAQQSAYWANQPKPAVSERDAAAAGGISNAISQSLKPPL